MLRALIADDHELVRRGLKLVLQEGFQRPQIGEAKNARETVEQVAAQKWDLVVLDINMPGRSGLDVLAEIKRLRPKVPVLILSASPEDDYAVRSLKMGASGYINKQYASDELLEAVREILAGGTYVSGAVAKELAAGLRGNRGMPHQRLSDREFQVFRLIALGRTVKEVAGELSLSGKTVGTYLTRIKEKTGLRSHVEITRYAFQNKLVE
jgi:DNA-binding NarL/FixJ family response regulator